jgi:hypothetical protein
MLQTLAYTVDVEGTALGLEARGHRVIRYTTNGHLNILLSPIDILTMYRQLNHPSVPSAPEDQPFHTRFSLAEFLGATTSNFGSTSAGRSDSVENPIEHKDYVDRYMA